VWTPEIGIQCALAASSAFSLLDQMLRHRRLCAYRVTHPVRACPILNRTIVKMLLNSFFDRTNIQLPRPGAFLFDLLKNSVSISPDHCVCSSATIVRFASDHSAKRQILVDLRKLHSTAVNGITCGYFFLSWHPWYGQILSQIETANFATSPVSLLPHFKR